LKTPKVQKWRKKDGLEETADSSLMQPISLKGDLGKIVENRGTTPFAHKKE
jgi:hypothetical protein